MKKIPRITLGIMTTLGGFVGLGQIVFDPRNGGAGCGRGEPVLQPLL